MGDLRKHILCLAALLTVAVLSFSCESEHGNGRNSDYKHVLVIYSAGFNSLSSYLRDDIEDLKKGYLPSAKSDDALLIISKLPTHSNNYSQQTAPCLIQLTKGKKDGTAVCDTLYSLPVGSSLAKKESLHEFLLYIKDKFPAESYGMVVSSHATGWLPEGYFSNPEQFDNKKSGYFRAGEKSVNLPLYVEEIQEPGLPAVKTIGQEVVVIDGTQYTNEIEIEDFAAAIPMHLDYILFDACLMGGVEVAYSLRNVCNFAGFSPTEVLADGYDYLTLTQRLLCDKPQPMSVCSDFFKHYDEQTEESNRCATVSYVDCTKMQALTGVCKELFNKYTEAIAGVNPSRVQAYFYKNNRHWHYDLKDILAQAGATQEELARLQEALDQCVVYKATTPYFIGRKIEKYSGLSMYLPCDGSGYLDNYYKSLSWNQATNLVK